jgi:Domain of unknown function (DUF5658)
MCPGEIGSMTLESIAPALPNPLRIGLLFFTALQIMDFLTTVGVFSRGGYEANPVIRALIPWTGSPITALLLAKGLLVYLTWRLSRRAWIVYSGNALYSLVVLWNGLLFLSTYQ